MDEKCKTVNKKTVTHSFEFTTIKEAEIYFRQIGGVKIDEFMNKMRDEYGI